ncbi:hypothetical protein H0H87_000113 [Tephrocybe sp. NHM501043]|nr:hypothetical protein H0H87_000113 [Tephrocybe sp. NHM501043]
MKVAIIGAGPSGIVSCKSLLEAATPTHPFDPFILEQEGDIGGTFNYRSYEAKVINVQRKISGGHTISYVHRNAGLEDDWSISPVVVDVDYVVICTGLHVIPSIPEITGMEYFSTQTESIGPSAFHSHKYKSRAQLQGKRVMILGTGETGMDIAYEAAQAEATEVTLCSRSG